TIENIQHVAPAIQEFALLRRSASEIDGVAIWGTQDPPAYLAEHVVEGSFTFAPDSAGRAGLVIGATLADLLGANVGDRVTAFSMRRFLQDSDGGVRRPRVAQFYVTGIYETSLSNFDEIYAFTSLRAARDLLEYGPEEVTRF